jgi:hypothetical protein
VGQYSPFVLPRLAGGGGKRRGNCLRAKPEFFRVPPSARSKGSPQGQDWLGCLFLVSSFGHAKEEKENSKKTSPLSPQFPDEPFLPCPAAIARGPERKISLSHKKLVRSPPYSYTIDSAILSLFRKRQTQATPTTANEKNDGDSNLSHMRPAPSKS